MVESATQWALPAAALVLALAAMVAAVAVWRARGGAPRSFALALVLLTCVCGCLAMLDPRLPVHRVTASLDELEDVLASWSWSVWPRGEITVRVTPEQLQRERDFGDLIEQAISRGVRINVERVGKMDEGDADGGGAVRLVWRTEGREDIDLPDTVAFVETGNASVWPELAGGRRAECRVDGGRWQPGASLEALFQDRGLEGSVAFHRVACRGEGVEAVRYVLVTDRGVVVGLRDEAEWTPTTLKQRLVGEGDPGDPRLHGLLHPVLADVDAPPDTAGMLVLERPSTRRACDAARTVLGRGGTVVLADPHEGFVEMCPELRLVGDGKDAWRRVDRRPRLSVVIDQSMDDLEWEPSLDFDQQGKILSKSAPRRVAPSSRQVSLARDACKAAIGRAADVDVGLECAAIDRAVARCGGGLEPSRSNWLVSAICKPGGPPRPIDPRRRDEATLDASVELLLDEAGFERNGIFRDNAVVLAFPHVDPSLVDGEERLCGFMQREGGRVVAGWLQDRYGRYLTQLARDEWGARGCEVDTVVLTPEEADPARLADAIVARFDARSPDQATARATSQGRFWGDLDDPASAPIRFRAWPAWPNKQVMTPPQGFAPAITRSTVEHDRDDRVLAAGTIVERGHLLVLGYSPFEFPGDVPLTDDPGSPRWREARSAAHGSLGPPMLGELYARTAAFLRASPGAVVGVEETRDGRISIQVIRSIDDRATDLAALDVTRGRTTVAAPLVDVDVRRRAFTYALSRSDVDELVAGRHCAAVAPKLDDPDAAHEVVLCAVERASSEGIVLAGEPALSALASFTGGCYAEEPCDPDAGGGPHEIWILGVAVGFLGLWGTRVNRRMSTRRIAALLRKDEDHARERYDQPQSLVAAEGDWGLQTSSWPRTGAVGGHRPFEPGDRPSAVLPRDLLLMSRGELGVLPTVALRVIEAAPTANVIVNLGATMRVPAATDQPPKVRAAVHVAELLLSAVWQRHARASLVAAGLARSDPLVESVALHPGQSVISTAAALALGEAPKEPRPWSSAAEVGAIVYVSDYMQEDPHRLEQWLREVEAAGTRVAGVLVYSPAELAMVEGGILASSGAWVDRSDWASRDLEQAFRRRLERLEASFDITTGGLTIVDTTMSTDDLRRCLSGGRLAEVFR